jgi:hypothetical protein
MYVILSPQGYAPAMVDQPASVQSLHPQYLASGMTGDEVGVAVMGAEVGLSVGLIVGILVGLFVGISVGAEVGSAVMGAEVGVSVGLIVGILVGLFVGISVGAEVGSAVMGAEVGLFVGVRLHRSGWQKGPHSSLGYSFETNRHASSSDRLPPYWLILYSILSPHG